MMTEKPLFIPLKSEYYWAFVNRIKDIEYRRHNKTWRAKNCRVGRRVVLSCGYGKQNRVEGVIRSFNVVHGSQISGVEKVYGTTDIELAAIGIDLTDK